MKLILMLIVITAVLVPTTLVGGAFTLAKLKGAVLVRHGVDEHWVTVSAGDVLKPEDSIQLSPNASATLRFEDGAELALPSSVIIDCSDLRRMSQEELSLLLAMQKVRNVNPGEKRDDFGFPRTTTVHGANATGDATGSAVTRDLTAGMRQLNGAQVLYRHGYYGTCVYRSRSVFAHYPSLAGSLDARLAIARSFDALGMDGEALEEYDAIRTLDMPASARVNIDARIVQLRASQSK
jgi:hypothetical protein